jgi:uncharacterized membrane protein YfcA
MQVAEAGGAVLSALLTPVALVVCALGVLLVALSRYGAQAPAGTLRLPGSVAGGGASGVAFGLIGPAILQAILLLLIVVVIVLVMRRRRERPDSLPMGQAGSVGDHRRALWG